MNRSYRLPSLLVGTLATATMIAWVSSSTQLIPLLAADEKTDIGEAQRSHVRAIIVRELPNAKSDIVDVLVDEYQDLTDEDLLFLLEQKRKSGGLLSKSKFFSLSPDGADSGIDQFKDGDPAGPLIAPRAAPASSALTSVGRRPSQFLIDVIQSNLENVNTVGYRERKPVTVLAPGGSSAFDSSVVPNLAIGSYVETLNSLHVAIGASGAVFFELENGTVTRNGMFVRLSDGRLGLTAAGQSLALKNSPVVSADLQQLSIDRAGSIRDESQERDSAGKLPVVTVHRPGDLRTHDGVYFTTTSKVEAAKSVRLLPGVLELSNVDVDDSLQLLRAAQAAQGEPAK